MNIIWNLAFLLLTANQLLRSQAMPVSNENQCKELNRRVLHELWALNNSHENSVFHDSFYMVPEHHDTSFLTAINKTREYLPIPLYGNSTCQPSSAVTDEINARSHCPWYYVLNFDPERYPDVMVEAASDCTNCWGLTGHSCEKVTYPVRVLRKTGECDEQGFAKYEQGWQRLVTGFTCVAVSARK